MTRLTTHVRAMLLIVGWGTLLASCATSELSDRRTFTITLGGTPSQWSEFHKALQGHVARDHFECEVKVSEQVSSCDSLLDKQTPVPPTAKVTYVFLDELPEVMKKVGLAMNEVNGFEAFSATINLMSLTCTSACPYVQGCGNWCVIKGTCRICLHPANPLSR